MNPYEEKCAELTYRMLILYVAAGGTETDPESDAIDEWAKVNQPELYAEAEAAWAKARAYQHKAQYHSDMN